MAGLKQLFKPRIIHKPIEYPEEFIHTIPSTPIWINANLTLNVIL